MIGSRYGQLYYEIVIAPAVEKVRQETENAPKEKLERIMSEYKSSPWPHRLRRCVFYFGKCFGENLRYIFARDILTGKFSWIGADWENAIRENERIDFVRKERKREAWIERGSRVELFSGSLEEYEEMKGKRFKFIDNGEPDKSEIYCDFEDIPCSLRLGRLGVDALVRFEWGKGVNWGRGLPVKKL
jgi:hypothetical protein